MSPDQQAASAAALERLSRWAWHGDTADAGYTAGNALFAADVFEALAALRTTPSPAPQNEITQEQARKMRDALRKIAGNGNANGCNPQIMTDLAIAALAGVPRS